MNDDMCLLVSFLTKSDSILKVALEIEHGLNRENWDGYMYFREKHIETLIFDTLPRYIRSDVKSILAVEPIYALIINKKELEQC